MLFVGVDWGERHHDLCLLDQDGQVLAARRVADGLAGVGELHAAVAAHARSQHRWRWGSRPSRGLLVEGAGRRWLPVYRSTRGSWRRYRGRHRQLPGQV